jgi:hypothetical protein
MTSKLFLSTKAGEDELYARIRDDERGEPHRQRLENMWLEYRPYAPKGFRSKLQFEFHQRWWEIYLTLGLCRLGLPVSTSSQDDRPDLFLDLASTKVWFEAVAPKPGTKSDAIPEPVANGVQDLPMRECLLRLTQAITAKREAANSYIQRRIVSKNDAFVVAVSGCALNQFGSLLDWPQPVLLRVLVGAGDLTIPLDRSHSPYSTRQDAILRNSGSPVDTVLFEKDDFRIISAVLYSHSDPVNAPLSAETTLSLFLNPKADVEVPIGICRRMVTWRGEKGRYRNRLDKDPTNGWKCFSAQSAG